MAILNVRAIADWWLLRDYQAPAAVSSLAAQDTMTSEARRIFYVNHPQVISDVATFRQKCNFSEQTIVLGCYHSNQRGIDIYNVNDPRLNGILQVTAAHELLHAAYDRLSGNEKDKLNTALMAFYNNGLKDQRVVQTIDLYKKAEPNDVVDEMHSIFGTELASLPQELESHYRRYFTSRTAVVQFASNYSQEFASRLAQISVLDEQLTAMKAQIEADEQRLDQQLSQLQADRGGVENSQNPAVISQYNSRVNAYNAGVRNLKSQIDSYNALVDKRNSLAAELKGLQNAIDTRLQVQSTE
jgi:hypothetical protein